mmetsp:Transcript_5631/g.14311  ORF Transcript_5631/g.14311 Transcript_5631/m.14311 type:complete len:237 (-) Transcript_5631:784-1494(-)
MLATMISSLVSGASNSTWSRKSGGFGEGSTLGNSCSCTTASGLSMSSRLLSASRMQGLLTWSMPYVMRSLPSCEKTVRVCVNTGCRAWSASVLLVFIGCTSISSALRTWLDSLAVKTRSRQDVSWLITTPLHAWLIHARRILPVEVFGKATQYTRACGSKAGRSASFRKARSRGRPTRGPGFRTSAIAMFSPRALSLMPKAAASITSSCFNTASSISTGDTVSPPRLMTSLVRPVT